VRAQPNGSRQSRRSLVPRYLCATCGDQYPETEEPPPACLICEEPRQYVPPEGQRWTTLEGELQVQLPEPDPAASARDRADCPGKFERVYGAFGRHVLADGKGAVGRRHSAERYVRAITDGL